MAKLIVGKNDLLTTHPEIAAQAHGWDPTTVTAGSGKKLAWKCSTGHPLGTWEAVVGSRTKGAGCPICSGYKALVGFNDLLTTHPEIAAQAHGWDPTTVSAGSGKKMAWECSTGHPIATWKANVCDRTRGNGCPVCGGKKVLIGFNDLLTTHPEVAAQAHDWDPKTLTAGSHKKVAWNCSSGHPPYTWEATVYNRAGGKSCPACTGRSVLVGFNDLLTTHPEIAAQAHGWDPKAITYGCGKKLAWKCSSGHPLYVWETTVNSRTQGSSCAVCAGKDVLVGFNDLLTTHPKVASQAHGWDPTTVSAGSNKRLAWKCSLGHIWKASVNQRNRNGCAVCGGQKVLAGFNDLLTTHPWIAAQAHGWDPKTVNAGSNKKLAWKCSTGHPLYVWETTVGNRSAGKGCHICAPHGYRRDLNGYIYLMERCREQQIGITNYPQKRINTHQKDGWELIELAGPFSGELAWSREREVKDWLRDSIGTIEGTTENWDTSQLRVESLEELYERAGLSNLIC